MILFQHLAAETRRLEEMASARQAAERQAIERQYAAQAHALATDPLVRLQVTVHTVDSLKIIITYKEMV